MTEIQCINSNADSFKFEQSLSDIAKLGAQLVDLGKPSELCVCLLHLVLFLFCRVFGVSWVRKGVRDYVMHRCTCLVVLVASNCNLQAEGMQAPDSTTTQHTRALSFAIQSGDRMTTGVVNRRHEAKNKEEQEKIFKDVAIHVGNARLAIRKV